MVGLLYSPKLLAVCAVAVGDSADRKMDLIPPAPHASPTIESSLPVRSRRMSMTGSKSFGYLGEGSNTSSARGSGSRRLKFAMLLACLGRSLKVKETACVPLTQAVGSESNGREGKRTGASVGFTNAHRCVHTGPHRTRSRVYGDNIALIRTVTPVIRENLGRNDGAHRVEGMFLALHQCVYILYHF
jgi:hypothetical protein